MTFKYFDNADLYVGLNPVKIICDTCGQLKLCFDAEGFFGEEQLTSICQDCLANGKLNDLDIFTCEGDIDNLIVQLKQIHKDLSEVEIREIALEKTNELEKTTPQLVTWQDWNWPCSDGDYCKFIGFGSKPLYEFLAKDELVEDFFENSFYESSSYDPSLWDEVPDKEINDHQDSSQYGTLFYIFKSLNCDKYFTIQDSE